MINFKLFKLFLSLTIVTPITNFLISNYCFSLKKVSLNKVNNISNISEKDFDKNNNGQIFYQDISVLNNNTTSKDDSIIDDIQLAKVFYKKDNFIQKNIICGTKYTSQEQLDFLLKQEKNIKRQILFSSQNIFNVKNWKLYESIKTIKSLDKKIGSTDWTIHTGDICDFTNSYYIEDDRYYYSLITHETYIMPNFSNWYWPFQLIYNFDTKKFDNTRIEHYAPIAKGKTTQVSFSQSIQIGMGIGGVSINAGVSSSYTTLLTSPEIYDKGDLVKKYGKIVFSYINDEEKWEVYNTNSFRDYITKQSFQTSIQIYKTKKNALSKPKFLELYDSNEISMFGSWITSWHCHHWTEDSTIYVTHKFPQYSKEENLNHFEFRTPKYIMVNEKE